MKNKMVLSFRNTLLNALWIFLIPMNGYAQITEITFKPYNKQFMITGQTKEFPIIITPDTYNKSVIRFETSDSNVVTVDEEGFATGINPGFAYVYALSKYSTAGDMCLVHVRDDNTSLKLEAEDASLTAPLEIVDDATASGGKCITVPSGDHSNLAVPDSGRADFTFSLDEEGIYAVYLNLKAADVNNFSYYFKVDTGEWRTIGAQDTTWNEETKILKHSTAGIAHFPFLPGEHTIHVAYRQIGVKLDYIRLIRDSSSVFNYQSHYSETFNERRWINLFLPSYYHSTDKDFPVIYFFHGWGGTVYRQNSGVGPHLNFHKIAELVESDSVILILVDGKIRWWEQEMLHLSPYNMKSRFDMFYEDYVPELMQFIDENYRTIPDRSKRAVIGHSMGGGMVLRLGTKYPHLIGVVQPTCAGANHRLGTTERSVRYFTHQFVRNFHGVHVRIHETYGDYLNETNVIVFEAIQREQLSNILWEEFEGHHTIDICGRTVAFEAAFQYMMDAMNDPLPKPERWHFIAFRPDFEVWDYAVTSDLEKVGFIELSGVTKGGMGITTKEWMPDGPAIPETSINVTTAPIYKSSASYNLVIYNIDTDTTYTETVMSDADGRIQFSVKGDNQQVGIYDNDSPPEIVILSYNVNDTSQFLVQGQEVDLKLQVMNRGGKTAENVTLEITTEKGSVTLTDHILTIPSMDAGSAVWINDPVKVTADFTPPEYKSPFELRLNVAISDDQDNQWKDEMDVPVFFNVPEFTNILIDDDIAYSEYNNGNGFAEPGELIVLKTTKEELLRVSHEDEFVEFTTEEFWDFGENLAHSMIKLSDEAPVGHKFRFLARIEGWYNDLEIVTWQWGTASVEVNDNTSVKPFLNRDPSQNQVSIYPNPAKDGRFTIQFRSKQPESELAVTIIDLHGRSIFSTRIYPAPGNNRFVVSPGELLGPGVYVVSIEGNQCLSRSKLIVE